MGFCGYRYRFGLYAAHSNIINSNANTHFHNFTITLYVNGAGCKPDDNFEVERSVQDWFKPFQGQQLSNMKLFAERETTVEGMGDVFFEQLYDVIEKLGYELVKLEIYENPIRVYAVSDTRLDGTVNRIYSVPLGCIPIIQLQDNNSDEKNEISLIATEEIQNNNVKDILDNELNIKEATENQARDIKPNIKEENKLPIKNSSPVNKVLMIVKLLFGLMCFMAVAVVTTYIAKTQGKYLQGSDTFCHLYRADLILKNIMQGNWYPLYDSTWYNGVEIMRYWGPIPLYSIAGLEWIGQGGVFNAYALFLGTIIFIGGCGWLLWGARYNRIGLSILIGMLWFFMPENIRVVLCEGNLPRGVINSLLPFYFFFLWRMLEDKKKNSIWPLIIVTVLITLCHLGITIMLIVTVIIFAIIYSRINHSYKTSICAVGASISGIILSGIWVVPALIGGAAKNSSTNQVMKNFFQNAAVSLNPFNRLNGDILSFYFGLSIFIICIFGIIFGSKKVRPGFITAIILFLCTTQSIYVLFSKLPFSQFLWMIRFIPIGLAAAMVSFIMWKQLRSWMVILFSIMLLADCFISFKYVYVSDNKKIINAQTVIEEKAESMLLTEAKEITNQRLAVLDLSRYGAFAPYYISAVGKSVNYTFGAGWEGASTGSNIVELNEAVENGWYVYLFDRALELGNDTVLIPIENLKEKQNDVKKVIDSAKLSGYNLITNNGKNLLFHKDTIKQFGVVTEYKDIAIGESASAISMIFPSFEEGAENNINDYTFEELSHYRNIYLSGFTYDDKNKAEELLLKLSESGVQVYIDMNRVPVDKAKKRSEFLGVNSQSIVFTKSYPEIEYDGKAYNSLDFSSDIDGWNTVFLQGLNNVEGYYNAEGKTFSCIGTSKDKNLHFIGLNLVYYLQTTKDSEIEKLVEALFGMDGNAIPNRKLVPLNIEISHNKIKINSEYDNVNTTLSSLDIFSSKEAYKTYNHLIMVNSGSTVINIHYPHYIIGILVTCVGICLVIIIYIKMLKMKEYEENEKIKEKLDKQ